MKRTSLAFLVVFLLLALVASTACGTSPTSTPAPTPTSSSQATPTAAPTTGAPTPVPSGGVFKLGASLALSGGGAPWGIFERNVLQMTHDDINAAGGIKVGGRSYMIELIIYDDGYVPAGGTTNANKLVFNDKVQYMASFGGGIAPAAQAITEPNKVIMFPGAYGKTVLKGTTYTFRLNSDSAQFAYMVYPWIKENYPTVKNVAILGENVSAIVELMTFDREAIARMGWTIVSDQLADAGTKDFAPFATKAVAANPDLIIVEDSPASLALMLKSVYELGFDGPRSTLTSIDPVTMLTITSKESLEGLVSGIPDWSSSLLPKAANDFYATYIAKYGPPFQLVSAEQYPMLYVIKQAVEKAGTFDTDAVKAVMEAPGFTFDTPYGPSKFGNSGGLYDAPRQAETPLYVSQIRDGKNVTLIAVNPDWAQLMK